MPLRIQFCDARDGNVDILDAVPGAPSDNAVLCQIENTLEYLYRVFRCRTVDTVCGNFRNQRIIVGDSVELLLDLAHGVAGGADAQGVARIGEAAIETLDLAHEGLTIENA